MRSPRRTALLLPCLAVLLGGCSAAMVRSHYNPQANFAALRTYAWLPKDQAAPGDQQTPDENFDRRIHDDVDRDLQAKGYTPAGDAAPDFLLNYRFSDTPVSALQGDPSYRAWGTWWTVGPGWQMESSDDFEEGSLFLAVLDPTHQGMYWLGIAEARLVPTMSYGRTIERIDETVAELLKRFPPH
jgi:hypothetical protein